jgi:hypothetical protein
VTTEHLGGDGSCAGAEERVENAFSVREKLNTPLHEVQWFRGRMIFLKSGYTLAKHLGGRIFGAPRILNHC